IILWRTGSLPVSAAVWAAGFVLSLTGYLVPALRRPLFVGWMCAAYPIGWVVSHLVLMTIFYLVLTPIGMLMRLFGRDPMTRSFDRSAQSYWVAHNPGGDASRYFRQF